MARKFSLTGLVIFVTAGSVTQIWFALALALAFLVATVYFIPFQSSRNHHYSMLASMCVVVTLMLVSPVRSEPGTARVRAHFGCALVPSSRSCIHDPQLNL